MNNVEMFQGGTNERGFVRKAFDKAGLVASVFTIPSEIIGLGISIATFNPVGVGIFLGALEMERVQFTQHGKPPEQQSWYNPERIWDRIFGLFKHNKSASYRAQVVYGT